MGKTVEEEIANGSKHPKTSPKTKSKITKKAKKQLSTKELLTANSRPIPKEILDDVLKLAKEDNFCEDHNKSCTASIHTFESEAIQNSFNIKSQFVKHARLCLLRRDWPNLSKLLAIHHDINSKFPVLTKYLALCVAHTDEDLFDAYLQTSYSFAQGTAKGIQYCTKLRVNENTDELFPKNDD